MSSLGRELARKTLHVAMGGFAFLLVYLTPLQAAMLATAALLHNLLLLPLYGGRRLFRGRAARAGIDPGIVLYPASVLLLILLFPRRLEIVAAAWGYLAFGDGLATIAGRLAGDHGGKLRWNPDKSWAGLVAFAIAGGAGAALLYGWTAGHAPAPGWLVPVLAVGLVLALVETLPVGIDDNLVIGLGGGALLYAAFLIDPAVFAGRADLFISRLPWAVAVNILLAVAALRAGSVDRSGAVHGSVLGTVLWVFGGGAAFSCLAAFFVLGSVTTRLGLRTKLTEGTAQEKGGARGAPHAWANAGAGALFALLAAGRPDPALFAVAIAAAFATATADTLGSEIGQAWGRRTFLITTFRTVPRGTDGAVSLEGTAAGVAGAFAIAGVAWAGGMIHPPAVALVTLAAFAGSALESYLGAWLERRKRINNEAQNFLNTLAGGLLGLLLVALTGAA